MTDLFDLAVEQITHGPKHHFFGYIGQSQTIPWNRSGRYIVALRNDFQDHMPGPGEAADVILIDVKNDYAIRVVDQSHGWNPQQGTMFYWNPDSPETQFFFNDRDPETQRVFTVLFDISKGERIREYRYEDTPFGNSGVAQNGGYFLGLNYARMARLRLVTGYLGAADWTEDVAHPEDDGIFKVDVRTGAKDLIASFAQLRDALRDYHPGVENKPMFINHTLWNRDDDRIYFYARGNFNKRAERLNVPFTVNPDGSDLTIQKVFIGGHPEWLEGHEILGHNADDLVVYDTDQQKIVRALGDRSVFPDPGGDNAFSPDGQWIVNGSGPKGGTVYAMYRMGDGAWARTERYDQREWISGDLRSDPAPCWNRTSDQVLFPSISSDGTRQLFVMTRR